MSLPGSTTYTENKPLWQKKKLKKTLEERIEELEEKLKEIKPSNPIKPIEKEPPKPIFKGNPYSAIDDDEWTVPITPPDGGTPWQGDRDDVASILAPVLPPDIRIPNGDKFWGTVAVTFRYSRTAGGTITVDNVVLENNATQVVAGADTVSDNGIAIKVEETDIQLKSMTVAGIMYTVSDPAQEIELEYDANNNLAAGTDYRYFGVQITERITDTAVVSPAVTIGLSLFINYTV